MTKENSNLFIYLSMTFVVCLLLSNILAAKMLAIGKFSITAGTLVFPISYIINDVLSEVYGYKKTKNIVLAGFILQLFMIIVFAVAIYLPAPTWFENSDEFALILGSTPRIAVAGLISYLFGSIVNAKVLVKMRDKNEKYFGIRAVLSTLFGETVDSMIFVPAAFFGTIPNKEILIMILSLITLKTLYETIFLPITYQVIKRVKKYEGLIKD
jgi:uncharacterized integral membrane protein (TIGR00697 family)